MILLNFTQQCTNLDYFFFFFFLLHAAFKVATNWSVFKLSIRQIQSITVPLVSVTSHILWSKHFVTEILASHYYLYGSDSPILLIGQLSVCVRIYA
jgi:hypothetical protein